MTIRQQQWIGEIRVFATAAPPDGWVPCDGRHLGIADHQPLFSIIGWRFGLDSHELSVFSVPTIPARGGHRPPLVCIAVDGLFPPRMADQ